MKIVIEIPEELYKEAEENKKYLPLQKSLIIWQAVSNGTPLPKGHGRILDEKDILNGDDWCYDLVDMPEYIEGVKAIIEADTAEKEDREDRE